MDESTNQMGAVLSCSNPDCGCRITINVPCPHGNTYTCACGHPFTGGVTGVAGTPLQ
jgi:hypothetical protein